MTTPDRPRRDFSWPVSIDELQELEVLEILRGPDGQVLWRCDDRPAVSPEACGGVLMQHRHAEPLLENVEESERPLGPLSTPPGLSDAPDLPLASPTTANASSSALDVSELPQLAALLALTDMPDGPLVLQPSELLDVAAASPPRENAEHLDVPAVQPSDAAGHDSSSSEGALPELAALAVVSGPHPILQAPKSLAVATDLHENAEFLDVPALHVFQPELHALAADPPTESPGWPQIAKRPQSVPQPRRAEWALSRESTLARQWPEVVEFVEAYRAPDVPQVVQPGVTREEPAMDSPEVPMLGEKYTATAPRLHRSGRAAHVPARVLPTLSDLARIRGGAGERLALVAAGMLMGVVTTIVGVSRGPTATAHTGSAARAAVQAAAPAAISPVLTAVTTGSMAAGAPSRLTPLSGTVDADRILPAPGIVNGERIVPAAATAAKTPGVSRPVQTGDARREPRAAPAVLGAIERYTVAYNRLDARATAAVWPSANAAVLAKTFNGLREQRLTLSSCTTAVNGTRATASCSGTRRYRPRVGDHSTRIQQGRWRFDLRQAAGTWLIASVAGPSAG